MVAKTEHFDIYYDQKQEALLPRMALYLENAWRDVCKNGIRGQRANPIFFFADHNLFEENNIVPIGEGTGGVTELQKTAC